MSLKKKYKIKDLYVARLGRVTEEKFEFGRSIFDMRIKHTIDYDGPIGIFLINGKKAIRVSTGVEYYHYDGIKMPKKWQWFVNKSTSLTHYYSFKDEITSLTKEQIREFEELLNGKQNYKRPDYSNSPE